MPAYGCYSLDCIRVALVWAFMIGPTVLGLVCILTQIGFALLPPGPVYILVCSLAIHISMLGEICTEIYLYSKQDTIVLGRDHVVPVYCQVLLGKKRGKVPQFYQFYQNSALIERWSKEAEAHIR